MMVRGVDMVVPPLLRVMAYALRNWHRCFCLFAEVIYSLALERVSSLNSARLLLILLKLAACFFLIGLMDWHRESCRV